MSKSIREMHGPERVLRSLTVKSFLIVLFFVIIMGAILLVTGFNVYTKALEYRYCVSTYEMANAEAVMLDPHDVADKCDEILDLYSSFSEEERGDGTSEEYLSQFDSVIDEEFRSLQASMQIMKDKVGLRNAFVVALEKETNRMIYLIDADPNPETFCRPGSWDTYSPAEINALVDGLPITPTMERFGLTREIHATITRTEQWGTRCTGGETLFETGPYTVIVCLDEKLDTLMQLNRVIMIQYLLLILVVVVIISTMAILLTRKGVVGPINKLAHAARDYSRDKQENRVVEDHFSSVQIHTGDELEELSLTMQDMEKSLNQFEKDLTQATAEQERFHTEMSLSRRIQSSRLPAIFPAFPDRTEFDIYAVMDPAREVGGDFYDFFLIDEDHLCFSIADVSGKGIPGALFMMMSQIILQSNAMGGLSPAKVLEASNDHICNNNLEEMFVTVWLGVLEISTGKITASNAGHEYPVLIEADGKPQLIHDKHGFVLGGMEGMKYTDYEIQMTPGSRLFIYTDGVPEATSREKELFGTDRMLDALAQNLTANPQETLEEVQAAVEQFVGDEEQFDDLTMLCLAYH